MTKFPDKIILAGFMGTGKSSVGEKLAKKLGYTFIDTDSLVEKQSGRSIPEIFTQNGEQAFRRLEDQAIDRALAVSPAVIAVGGGAVCSPRNLKKLREAGVIILLTAGVGTILKRLGREHRRPLLQVSDPKEKIRELLTQRSRYYEMISWRVSTDGKSPAQISQDIYSQLPLEQGVLRLELGERSYPLYFQRNGFSHLSGLLQRYAPSEQVVVVTNKVVNRLYGRALHKALEKDFRVHKLVLPDGEKYKTLKTVAGLYRQLVRHGVDRKTPLVALGGGVIGDVAGFAAASYLRGIPLVQIPTTLLAQVDSSIGGKTGVDLPEGKNLVGAFYQPRFVWIDEAFLTTLSRRQFVCGMAEVIKYAAIFDAELFATLENRMAAIMSSQGSGMEEIIRRCCEWKAWVVENDEMETKGLRSKLNFGHTLGHAIESLTGYKKFTHGEAIAMGMAFAAQKSVDRTGLKPQALKRLMGLLQRAELPTVPPVFSKAAYRRVMARDKKRVSGRLNFVYLSKIGKSVVLPTDMEDLI
jgi:3-dehydroquinate synthase